MASTKEKMKGSLRYDPITGLFYKNGVRVGHIRKDGYVLISGGCGVLHLGHRLAWKIMYGRWLKNEIDHVDGNRSNNSIYNLKEATRAENATNLERHRNGLKRKRPPERDWRRRIYLNLPS